MHVVSYVVRIVGVCVVSTVVCVFMFAVVCVRLCCIACVYVVIYIVVVFVVVVTNREYSSINNKLKT